MAVVIETTLGDITVDLFVNQRPTTCLNFLKLCKMKYYNFNLFHTIQSGFIAQTGDPTGEGTGGQSIFGLVEGPEKRFFSGEKMPKIRHADAGLLSMVSTGESMIGSQFFFTLGPDLDSLDGVHCVIGSVTEGQDVLRKLNDVICDETHRPYQDVRITHTVVLDDPFSDPVGMKAPSRSPSPSAERLKGGRIAPDEELDETQGKSTQEIQEIIEEKEAKARATILEIVGDLPDADVAPPENVLFVCKLNPVTTDEDLEIIFSRFGTIVGCEVIRDKKTGDSLQYAFIEFDDKKSCEDAYFKMDNVLIDDRRIHVDFSQSVSKMRWLGKGKGIRHYDNDGKEENKRSDRNDSHRNSRTDRKDYSRHERTSDNRNEKKYYYKDDKTSDHRGDKKTEHRDNKKSENRQERKSDHKQTDSKHERRLDHSERDRSLDRKKSRNSPSKNYNKIKDKILDSTESSKRDKSPSKYDKNTKDKNHDRQDRSARHSSNYKKSESKRYERRSDGTDRKDRHERESTNNKIGYNEIKSPHTNNTMKVNDKENCELDDSKKSKDNTSRKNGHEHEKAAASKMTLDRFEKRKKEKPNHEVVDKKTIQEKNENDLKLKHNTESKIKSKSHKNTESKDEKSNDKNENKLSKTSKRSKADTSSTKKDSKSKKLTNKHNNKKHLKNTKKRKRESTSISSSDSSTDSSSSSSDSSSSSSSDAKTKKKIKRKHSTSSSSSSSSDSSSSSSSDSSSDSSSSSSDSDEPKKKKKKGSMKPSQKLKKK